MRDIGAIIALFLMLCNPSIAKLGPLEQWSCRGKEISPTINEAAISASKKLEGWLNQQGADLIVIGRRGQDLTAYNIEFSHVAFAIRERNRSWSVWHLLNECPTTESGIYKESLKEFLVVAPEAYEVGMVLFSPEIEQALRPQLEDPTLRERLYEPFYSSVAHPYQLSNQNSNGWVVEFFISALEGKIESRERAQRLLKDHNYHPDIVSLNIKQTILSQLFVGNATLAGHKMEDVRAGRLYIHSGDSILNFMAKFGRQVDESAGCMTDQYELIKPTVCILAVGEESIGN